MTFVVFHFWAGARAAAGVETERYEAANVAAAITAAGVRHADTRLARVLTACSFLVDGRVLGADELDEPVSGEVIVEVLPPFAGGALPASSLHPVDPVQARR